VAHHALGLSLVRQGRTREALMELRRAHELDPADARLAYVYAVARHDTGDVAGAILTLREALRTQPHDRDLAAALAAYERE
ncbi:MAG: tetratricopeptide repeat protein, partial [Gammaproteobacteria bacterium]|nr:tetratricopeptide repeat protein [Gammaproteobacteria bacterium]